MGCTCNMYLFIRPFTCTHTFLIPLLPPPPVGQVWKACLVTTKWEMGGLHQDTHTDVENPPPPTHMLMAHSLNIFVFIIFNQIYIQLNKQTTTTLSCFHETVENATLKNTNKIKLLKSRHNNIYQDMNKNQMYIINYKWKFNVWVGLPKQPHVSYMFHILCLNTHWKRGNCKERNTL